jgi:signal transduction histidine kinase
MTKAQIEALGGSIDIVSAPDKGATFIITIPVQQGE